MSAGAALTDTRRRNGERRLTTWKGGVAYRGCRPDLDPAAVERRFETMQVAMPEAMLDPPPHNLIASMPNEESDRHVLAAAVIARAEVIVTENISDFSPEVCGPFGVEAQTLDQFLGYLVSLDSDEVWRAIEEMARRRTRPPMAVDDVVATLKRYVPTAIAQLQETDLI